MTLGLFVPRSFVYELEVFEIVVLHEIRKVSNIPVIMLTALDDEYGLTVSIPKDMTKGMFGGEYIQQAAHEMREWEKKDPYTGWSNDRTFVRRKA